MFGPSKKETEQGNEIMLLNRQTHQLKDKLRHQEYQVERLSQESTELAARCKESEEENSKLKSELGDCQKRLATLQDNLQRVTTGPTPYLRLGSLHIRMADIISFAADKEGYVEFINEHELSQKDARRAIKSVELEGLLAAYHRGQE